MKNDFENVLGKLSANNAKISEKLPELKQFAESADGQKLKEKFAGSEEMKKVMESGDSCSIQNLISSVLQSEEGKRIAKQLSDMMNK
jgi:hypothetical protein